MASEGRNFQIFVRSPDLQIPTRALIFENPEPGYGSILDHLKSSLLPAVPRDYIFFTLNGKPLPGSTSLLRNFRIPPSSTLTAHLRLHGGGGDGGSTCAESRDCFLNMYAVKKPDKADPNEVRLSKWVNCSLSNEPLKHPVVIDKLGNLFNKEALVEGLVKKNLPKEFGYIKGLKDMIPVELASIPGVKENGEVKFRCPISGQEFNGKCKFFALRNCGHVISAKGLKEVKSSACLVCHKEFVESDKLVINGSEEEVKELWNKMTEEKVKDNAKKSKKVKHGDYKGQQAEPMTGKKHAIEVNCARSDGNGLSKKFKASDIAPANASKAVYASIFTSSKKSDFKETYSCRSLPLGRN